jgi:hypothetical protein
MNSIYPTIRRLSEELLSKYNMYFVLQLKRLTDNSAEKAVDCKRTQKDSIYKDMGVVNAYIWRGYN